MTAQLLPWPLAKFFQPNTNLPLTGGKVYTYAAGTSTPLATYSDSAGLIPNTNPVILDTNGQANIYLTSGAAYKINILDASNVQIPDYPIDNIITNDAAALVSVLRADLANPTDITKGDALLAVKYPYAGALAQTQHMVNSREIWLDGFTGYDGTGATNSDAAFLSAIAAIATLGGGQINILPGAKLKLATQLISNVACLLHCAVRSDLSNNTNGGGFATAHAIIQWTGAAGGYMYTVKPASTGDVIFGGGSIGIEWDGNALAASAVHLDNTKFAKFDGKVRSVTFAGVVVDSTSGSITNFSQLNEIDLEFIYGASVACRPAHGLLLGGNGSTVPSTQQQIKRATGLVYNGSMVRIAETDNCQGLFVSAAVEAGGTGCALEQINAGFGPANHNHFLHLVGPIKNDNGIIGPFIAHYNSEGGGITQTAGSSVYSGELIDYLLGRTYTSHKYALRRKISLSSANFLPGATAGTNLVASQWQMRTWPETGGDVDLSAVMPDLYELDDGFISAVELFYIPLGTSNGTIRVVATLSTCPDASSVPVVTPDGSVTATLNTGVQYLQVRSTMTFAAPIAYTKGDTIYLNLKRKSGDAADTQTGDIALLGARILYYSKGPHSAGSGTYDISDW